MTATPAPGSVSLGTPLDPASKSMDELVALCKRRGFVYPASEIYGGINGFWDYGPLGTQLKNNIRDWWWKCLVECPPIGPDGHPVDIVGLDSAIIQNPKTWVASGHVGGFSDPMTMCKECKKLLRADHVWFVFYANPDEVGQHGENLAESGKSDIREVISRAFARERLDPVERQRLDNLEANLERAERETKPHPFLLAKGVLAGSLEEAIESVEFTAKERKAIEKHGAKVRAVVPFINSDPVWGEESVCPNCAAVNSLTPSRQFNLMFESHAGAIKDDANKVYLRPETAQGIFLNYKNVLDTMRVKVPFGIAQIGKSFRNELTPRNYIFRSREFEQMEMEWFCPPEDSAKWYEFWKEERMNWWRTLGIAESNLRFRDHDADELAHYSKMCVDVEYKYPFTAPGFGELEGIAHRGCFDLTAHSKHNNKESNTDMHYFDQERQLAMKAAGASEEEIKEKSRYIPNVIEPASGLTRAVLVLLCEAFTPTPDRSGSKYILSFKPKFAPVKAGVFPLVNKDGMPEIAQKLYMDLRGKHMVEYDAKQSIGKRYARMDEIGTPMCFTIDGETPGSNTVTVRDRDTLAQERINLDKVGAYIDAKLAE